MKIYKYILILILFSAGSVVWAQDTDKYLVNVNDQGVMLDGHDVVAYFRENKPVKGSAQYLSNYDQAKYYFSSAENKDLFDTDPSKYAPEYGGYCAVAAAFKKVEEVEYDKFQIYQGSLYMNRNAKAVAVWNDDPAGIVKKADKNWPRLVKKFGTTH